LIELHVQATLAREAATPEVVARALARGLVRATQGASAASVGAGASAEDPAAKRARSQVDVLEVLLCLLRAEHRFLCSRTALLRQHMALLPHAATPCQRAAFWQRLQGIVELQLVAAPPLPPPPVLIPPRRSIIRSLEHRNAEMAATRRAAHAGIRLVSAVSWAYGIASDAQAHSLIKEASVVARLCSLAAAADRESMAAQFDVGLAALHAGDATEARDALRRAIELAPSGGVVAARAEYALAELSLMQLDGAGALEHAMRAQELAPQDVDVAIALYGAYRLSGRHELPAAKLLLDAIRQVRPGFRR
jgi:tetratricopeptide (TPR) repeat protein